MKHLVNGTTIEGPFPDAEVFYVGMGCFWGAEKKFWQTPGVVSTAVGYQGGDKKNPTYKEVCGHGTGHVEVVQVVFDPLRTNFAEMLRVFWENHDPTQGERQGNDAGPQYRSVIFTTSEAQKKTAEASREMYAQKLKAAGYGPITTEIAAAPTFWLAEEYHQQYLAKNPDGYCGIGGTGVACPIGVSA